MQANGYVQGSCPKCNGPVWTSAGGGLGYCPNCQAQVTVNVSAAPQNPAIPYGAPPAAGAPAQNPFANIPGARRPGGTPVVPVIFGILVLVIGSVAFASLKSFVFKKKGTATASDVGIDPKSADPAKMIEGTRALARKWRSDAEFYSINVVGLKSDGTVDLKDGGTVTITFYSRSGVTSSSANARKDSVKKFVFNDDRVDYTAMWGTKKPWKGVTPTPTPTCNGKKLSKAMKDDDVSLDKGAVLSIDPRWGFAWHVVSGSSNLWYDLEDCSGKKLKLSGDEDDGVGNED